MKTLSRRSNTINIATFWENYVLGKYNFEAPYQREGDVWHDQKKSFLMDTIIKNFPIPPIFLHEKIDKETGRTIYDIIDGKQRLTAIKEFIENTVPLPTNFGEDGFGDESLSGCSFSDLDNKDFVDAKMNFWKYEISIEYVNTDEIDVVNNIFDRLNRNGEPLNAQELRKAKYHSTKLYAMIEDLSNNDFWEANLFVNLDKNRYEHIEYVSELVSLIVLNQIKDSNKKSIDAFYDEYASKFNEDDVVKCTKSFKRITDRLAQLNINYLNYKINSVSHFFGLWAFVWKLDLLNNNDDYSMCITEFYYLLRAGNPKQDVNVEEYRSSMQSGTKSRSYRIKRVNALLKFCNVASTI